MEHEPAWVSRHAVNTVIINITPYLRATTGLTYSRERTGEKETYISLNRQSQEYIL
jgi:hypothetical protein